MKSNKKRRPGFYWVRFEGSITVAEWDGSAWFFTNCLGGYLDYEVCERLSNRLEWKGLHGLVRKYA